MSVNKTPRGLERGGERRGILGSKKCLPGEERRGTSENLQTSIERVDKRWNKLYLNPIENQKVMTDCKK